MDETNKNETNTAPLVTEEMNEFISSKPGRLLQYGNYILFLLLVSILIICWSVRSPEVISVEGTLNSYSPIIPVRAPMAGYIDDFQVKNGEFVQQYASLGYLRFFYNDVETILQMGKDMDSIAAMIKTGRKFPLLAPVEGKCVLAGEIKNNHYFNKDDTILFIYPRDPEYYVRIDIPQHAIQKIKVGQRVLLNFDAYPAFTFGSLTGTVEFINPVANNKLFTAKVRLGDTLITNLGSQLELKEGMMVQGTITVGNTRMIKKISTLF